MSIDTHNSTVAGFRCEPITTGTTASPCLHSRLENRPRLDIAPVYQGESHPDDPAVLIGLALASVRQSPDGIAPVPLMAKLSELVEHDNAACRLVLDWLRNRNRRLGRFANEHSAVPAPVAMSTKTEAICRSLSERVLAASTKPGHLDGRRQVRTRPRDPEQNTETAIIAAKTGGRTDG